MAVTISGLGVVTPFGIGAPRFFQAAMEGRGPARLEIEEVRRELEGRRLRTFNEETMVLLLAVRYALTNGGTTPPLDPGSLGVAVSTRHAGLKEYAALYWQGTRNGRRVKPTLGPQTGFNAPAAHVSIDLGAEGPNATFPSGPVAGLEALSWAIDAIEGKDAAAMLVCGVDLPVATATGRVAGDGGAGPRPFDIRRFGSVPAAGAAAILLEDERSLRRRGRRPGAIVESVATAFSSDGDLLDACSRAMEDAIGQTAWRPSQIGSCFAGANGSVWGDASEAFALHDVLARDTAVTAIKGSSGETEGAGALLQVAAAALSLSHATLPPTTGLVRLDPALPPLMASSSPFAIDVERPLVVHAFDSENAAGAAVLRAGGRRS
jgi:3-oxoacyl-[acyl-carrier-protein] synthase II